MNNFSAKTTERLVSQLCYIALFLIAGMFFLGLRGDEDSAVFTSFDRLAFLITGGVIGFLKQVQTYEPKRPRRYLK